MVLRRVAILALVAAIALWGGGTGFARNGAATVTVSLAKTSLGDVLVATGGKVLYHTSAEAKNTIKCTGACAVTWPPLVISAHTRLVAGPGVKASLLGKVKRPDGRAQVTYAGLPLYRYSGDTKPDEANGQGIGGSWHVLAPNGRSVMKPGPGPSTASPSSSTDSSGMNTSTTASSGSSGSTANPGMFCAAYPKSCVNGVPVSNSP